VKIEETLVFKTCVWFAFLVICFVGFSATRMQGQCTATYAKGVNTVYGNCNGGTPHTQGSIALVDASQFSSSGDI
jgi:hypothetical protein